MKLKIKVERIEFDAEQCSLRLNGRNVEENEHVKLGQYHTIELEIGRPCTIEKSCWDFIFFRILDDACDPGKKAEVAVVGEEYIYMLLGITLIYSFCHSCLNIL
jgi:protein pelota